MVLENFTFLGSTLSKSVVMDDEVNTRFAKTSAAFGRLTRNVWHLGSNQNQGMPSCYSYHPPLWLGNVDNLSTAYKEAKPLSHDLSREDFLLHMTKTHPRHRSFDSAFSSQHQHHLDTITASLDRSCYTQEKSPSPEQTVLRRTVLGQALPKRSEKALQRHIEGLPEIFRYRS